MARFSEDDMDRAQQKARPRGTLPYLPTERDDPAKLAAWLTLALRPAPGWRAVAFERAGRDPMDPCTLVVMNSRDSRAYRFAHQKDLAKTPRTTITSATDGWLAVPHLTGSEIEDLWQCLCQLGSVLTETDERDEARKWIEQMLPATMPLRGHSLEPDARYGALMAIRKGGEFTRPDALALVRGGSDNGHQYQQRPVRFVDQKTGEQWLRVGETATFIRWVLGVEPLPHSTLRARLAEIEVVARLFEDHRPPHPKSNLFQLTATLIEGVGGK